MTKRNSYLTLTLAAVLLSCGSTAFAMGYKPGDDTRFATPFSNFEDKAGLVSKLQAFEASLARLEEHDGLKQHGAISKNIYRAGKIYWTWRDTAASRQLEDVVETYFWQRINTQERDARETLADAIDDLQDSKNGTFTQVFAQVHKETTACRKAAKRVRQLLFATYPKGRTAYTPQRAETGLTTLVPTLDEPDEITPEEAMATINGGMMGQTVDVASNATTAEGPAEATAEAPAEAAPLPIAPLPAVPAERGFSSAGGFSEIIEPAAEPGVVAENDTETYKVRSGDTVGGIAMMVLRKRMREQGWKSNMGLWGENGLVALIERYNGLQPGGYIHPGQEILIPDAPELKEAANPKQAMSDWFASMPERLPPVPRGLSTAQRQHHTMMHVEQVKTSVTAQVMNFPSDPTQLQAHMAENKGHYLEYTKRALTHSRAIKALHGDRTPKELKPVDQALREFRAALCYYDPAVHGADSDEAQAVSHAMANLREETGLGQTTMER